MFINYLYKTNTSKKNVLHFKNYAKEVSKIYKKKEVKILDIASNDGTFLSNFKNTDINYLGFEPSKNVAQAAKKNNTSPQQHVDRFVKRFQKTWDSLDIEYIDFIGCIIMEIMVNIDEPLKNSLLGVKLLIDCFRFSICILS